MLCAVLCVPTAYANMPVSVCRALAAGRRSGEECHVVCAPPRRVHCVPYSTPSVAASRGHCQGTAAGRPASLIS